MLMQKQSVEQSAESPKVLVKHFHTLQSKVITYNDIIHSVITNPRKTSSDPKPSLGQGNWDFDPGIET